VEFPTDEVDNGLRGHAFPDAYVQGWDQHPTRTNQILLTV
jgi:hypothetical protein